MSSKRANIWLTSAVVALWLPFVAIGSQAAALPGGDPSYPGPSPSPPEDFTEACVLTAQRGEPGETITAEVSGVPIGTPVRILFDGQEVGSGVAEAEDGSTTGTAVITFAVPAVSDGTYTVFATGPTFNEACGSEDGSFVVVNSRVLTESVTNEGAGGGRGGLLPRTGIELAMWLAIAAVLVLVGRAFVTEARRRRRARRAQARRHRSTAGV